MAAFVNALRTFSKVEHPCGQLDAQLAEVTGSAPAEDLDAFRNFDGMAGGAAQRLIHVGDQGHGFLPHALAGLHHDFGQADGVFFALHEGTATRFHVEDERVDSFGEFLAHDGSADQAGIFDRCGDIAKSIDFFVRRREGRGR